MQSNLLIILSLSRGQVSHLKKIVRETDENDDKRVASSATDVVFHLRVLLVCQNWLARPASL